MQPDLDTSLRHLRLTGMAQMLPVRNQEAISNSLAYVDFLDLAGDLGEGIEEVSDPPLDD